MEKVTSLTDYRKRRESKFPPHLVWVLVDGHMREVNYYVAMTNGWPIIDGPV